MGASSRGDVLETELRKSGLICFLYSYVTTYNCYLRTIVTNVGLSMSMYVLFGLMIPNGIVVIFITLCT